MDCSDGEKRVFKKKDTEKARPSHDKFVLMRNFDYSPMLMWACSHILFIHFNNNVIVVMY